MHFLMSYDACLNQMITYSMTQALIKLQTFLCQKDFQFFFVFMWSEEI